MRQATVISEGLTLPEGMRWQEDRLWFSDLYNRRVVSVLEDGSDLLEEFTLEDIPSGIDWLPDGRLLVAAQSSRLLLRREADGASSVHADLSHLSVGWLNDMLTTSDGTSYVGCHGFDINHNEPFRTGPIMKVSPEGTVSVVGEPAYFSNGSTLVDGTFVVAESFANRMSQYDIDDRGDLVDRRDWAVFGEMPTAIDLGERYQQLVVAADGISRVDADGAIWVADFTKPRAVRVMPGGQIVDEVRTADGSHCFCVALGGHDGRTLFLCAAPGDDLDPEVRRSNPLGTIQSVRVPVRLA